MDQECQAGDLTNDNNALDVIDNNNHDHPGARSPPLSLNNSQNNNSNDNSHDSSSISPNTSFNMERSQSLRISKKSMRSLSKGGSLR